MKSKVKKSPLIRALIDKGSSDQEIIKKLFVSPQLVHIVRRNYLLEKQSLANSKKKVVNKNPPKVKLVKGNHETKAVLIAIIRALVRELKGMD